MSNKGESSADVGPDVVLGSNTAIWHLAQGALPSPTGSPEQLHQFQCQSRAAETQRLPDHSNYLPTYSQRYCLLNPLGASATHVCSGSPIARTASYSGAMWQVREICWSGRVRCDLGLGTTASGDELASYRADLR